MLSSLGLRITDAHVHVFARDSPEHPWRPELAFRPDRAAPIEQLQADLAAGEIDDAVLVQPSVYSFDHSYLRHALALAPERFRGIMLVDPLDPTYSAAIHDTVEGSAITGLRMIPLRVDRDWFSNRSEPLWRSASELSIAISYLVGPTQLASVGQWAQRYPGVPVVIDHMGRPDLSETGGLAAVAELLEISRLPNIHVKVSGIGGMSRLPPPHRDTWDWIRAVIDSFGVDRVMWGSDYPWVLETGTIDTSLSTTASALFDLGTEEAEQVFGGTARRLFGFH